MGEFFPSNNQQQTEENFRRVFAEKDLPEVVAFRNQVAAANIRSELTRSINEAIADEKSVKDIIADVKDIVVKTGIAEQDVVVLIWQSVMTGVEQEGRVASGPSPPSLETISPALCRLYQQFQVGNQPPQQDPRVLLRQHELLADIQQNHPPSLQD